MSMAPPAPEHQDMFPTTHAMTAANEPLSYLTCPGSDYNVAAWQQPPPQFVLDQWFDEFGNHYF